MIGGISGFRISVHDHQERGGYYYSNCYRPRGECGQEDNYGTGVMMGFFFEPFDPGFVWIWVRCLRDLKKGTM